MDSCCGWGRENWEHCCESGNKNSGSLTYRELLAFENGLCSMELVNFSWRMCNASCVTLYVGDKVRTGDWGEIRNNALSGASQHEIRVSSPIARKITEAYQVCCGMCFVASQDINTFFFMLVIKTPTHTNTTTVCHFPTAYCVASVVLHVNTKSDPTVRHNRQLSVIRQYVLRRRFGWSTWQHAVNYTLKYFLLCSTPTRTPLIWWQMSKWAAIVPLLLCSGETTCYLGQ